MPERFENGENFNEELAAYLEGELSPQQKEDFEGRLREDEDLFREIELQKRIDQSLLGLFAVPDSVPRFDFSGESSFVIRADESQRGTIDRRRLFFWAAAACAVWAMVFVFYPRESGPQLQFVQRPVTEIYRECVDGGFRPYWDCNGQEARFADTFRQRQGVPLALGELPDGCRMAGLSYLPAISRDTTAMLAYSDDRPVILFVDRKDKGSVMESSTDDEGLYLHSKTLGELVLFELTPDAEPRFLDTIQFYSAHLAPPNSE